MALQDTLPPDWEEKTASEKITYFNARQVTPQELEDAGVPVADIEYMRTHMGYMPPGTTASTDGSSVRGGDAEPTASITRDASDEGYVGIGANDREIRLPSDWYDKTAEDKIDWFNTNRITPEDMRAVGVAEADIDWMKNHGYSVSTGETTRATTRDIDPSQSTLSPNFADYVYRMLARAEQAADMPYQEYTGPRFAGSSALQQQAFAGISSLADPAAYASAQRMLEQAGAGLGALTYTPTQFTTGLNTPISDGLASALAELPQNWESFTPAQKISWFNENQVDPGTLSRFGVTSEDVSWMREHGYSVPDYSAQLARMVGDRIATSVGSPVTLPDSSTVAPAQMPQTITPPGGFAATPSWNPGASAMAANIGVSLPHGWGGYTPEQKISYFNQNEITGDQLLQAGVPQADISWMRGQGYTFADGGTTTTNPTTTAQPMAGGLGQFQLPTVAEYMNPYTSSVTNTAASEARRQADIGRTAEQARLAQAGAYGGSRQAIMESERQRNLNRQIGDITNTGLQSAYDRAMDQRLKESGLGLESQKLAEQSRQFGSTLGLQALQSQTQTGQALGQLGTAQGQYGLSALNTMLGGGATQQGFAQQPLDFGYQQWRESLAYPYQQGTYMSSMLGGLPLAANPYSPGGSALGGGIAGLTSLLSLLAGITG